MPWARQLKEFGQVLKRDDKCMMGKGLTQSPEETQKHVDKRTPDGKLLQRQRLGCPGQSLGVVSRGALGAGAWGKESG